MLFVASLLPSLPLLLALFPGSGLTLSAGFQYTFWKIESSTSGSLNLNSKYMYIVHGSKESWPMCAINAQFLHYTRRDMGGARNRGKVMWMGSIVVRGWVV